MRRSATTRLPRPSVLAALVLMLFMAVVLFASAGSAVAKSGFLGDFNALYGTAGSPLDSCSLCHTNVPSLNGYGNDWTNNSKSFGAIESRDSDSDGWTNIQEIQARTMPGNASSAPPPVTTTTQPPTSTTQPPGTTTTAPPATTTTLPPSGSGPINFDFKEFKVPSSVDVNGGSVSREITVKLEVDNAPSGNLTTDIQLWANGQLAQTITRTRQTEDGGEAEYEVKFDFTFTSAHVHGSTGGLSPLPTARHLRQPQRRPRSTVHRRRPRPRSLLLVPLRRCRRSLRPRSLPRVPPRRSRHPVAPMERRSMQLRVRDVTEVTAAVGLEGLLLIPR